MLLEKRIIEKLKKAEEIWGDKDPEEMSEEKRREVLNIILSTNNFYDLLTQQKGNNYRVDLLNRIDNLSNKLLEYKS